MSDVQTADRAPVLGWDIVYLLEGGHITDAVQTLAAQRRIAEADAALTVTRWLDAHDAKARG